MEGYCSPFIFNFNLNQLISNFRQRKGLMIGKRGIFGDLCQQVHNNSTNVMVTRN